MIPTNEKALNTILLNPSTNKIELSKRYSAKEYQNLGYKTFYLYIDNTIITKKIKNSWNREEIIELIKKYSSEACGQPWFEDDDKWIEKNLN